MTNQDPIFFNKSGTSHELFAWLSDVLFKYIVNKKWKKRWGRKEIDDIKSQSLWLMRKESDLDGYSSCFLILSLSDVNSSAHHIVCSHGLPKKAGKRLLEEKYDQRPLCVGIIRITHNSRNKSYQNQYAVIGHLPGPWGFWTLTLLQSLFATNLAVCFPARKALRETETDKYVKAVFFFGDGKSEKQISAHENVKSRDGGWRNGCVSSLIAPLRWRVWLSPHQRSGLHKHTFHRFLLFWMFWKRKICHRQTNVQYDDWSVFLWVCMYRAGMSIHSGLIKLLSNCEGDMGGPYRGGGLDWQGFSVLRNLHGWLWRGCDRNLTQHHIHTWQNTHMHIRTISWRTVSTLASIEFMENCSFIEFKGQKDTVRQIRGMKAMLLRLALLHTSALSADIVWWHHLI